MQRLCEMAVICAWISSNLENIVYKKNRKNLSKPTASEVN